ncbi:uncharacterized protein LOC106069452 isoform X2 [Biomphalaria glabrata]|uniref:Uncharacterized protein LOC106069452 isoform X2 n=1 Tax=Biomphalaria glabrata TaxID=6526 RepID=A0A9W3AAV4_BIOGL|nr:uncharacterized protein LOC106069452 isoform X2 [Biomphalaria glabrata]
MLGLRLCVALIAYPLLAYCCLPDSFQVLDLSHTLSNESLRWPGGSNFSFTILTRGWQNNNSFWPADVESWEKVNGPIPKGAIVFMRSGWDTRYPNKKLTFNTNTPDNESTFHFPGFHPDTARWLIVNRNIGMIGIDTPSTDYGPSPNFEVHQIISNASVMGLENVNNLGALPPKGFIVTVAPVKLFDGSGGPVRILALVSKDGSGMCTTNSAGRLMLFWAFKFGLWHVLSSLWKICIT